MPAMQSRAQQQICRPDLPQVPHPPYTSGPRRIGWKSLDTDYQERLEPGRKASSLVLVRDKALQDGALASNGVRRIEASSQTTDSTWKTAFSPLLRANCRSRWCTSYLLFTNFILMHVMSFESSWQPCPATTARIPQVPSAQAGASKNYAKEKQPPPSQHKGNLSPRLDPARIAALRHAGQNLWHTCTRTQKDTTAVLPQNDSGGLDESGVLRL